MILQRKAQDRGHANLGWLDTYHTFSFASYYDPEQRGISHLRVINEDRVEPGGGFASHPHQDMEIISYVLEGALRHKDSMGNGSIIRAGEVQRMSAGTGITHSEYNDSNTEQVHFLQIWVRPDHNGGEPSYAQEVIPEHYREMFELLAGPTGSDAVLTIQQDARLYVTKMSPDSERTFSFSVGRCGYLYAASGEVEVNGVRYSEGDGACVLDESGLSFITRDKEAEVLVFDLLKEKS